MNYSKKILLSRVKVFGLPVGILISRRSFLAEDQISQKGMSGFSEIIAKGDEGVSVFFAHLGLIDVFSTGMLVEKYANFKAVFPVAASWFHFPVLSSIFNQINKQVTHKFIPVFRKEEMGYSDQKITFINFSGLNHDQKKLANKKYVEHSKDVLNKGGVVMLAPYGGRSPKPNYLRSGPVRMLQKGGPTIFSLTYWNWKKFCYDIYFSEIYHFDESIEKPEAHEAIYKEFSRMAKLSGISKKKMLESKSSSSLSKALWNLVARVILIFYKNVD